MVEVQALYRNHFNGHMLNGVIAQSVALMGVESKHIMVDKVYRGHQYPELGLVHLAGRDPQNIDPGHPEDVEKGGAR